MKLLIHQRSGDNNYVSIGIRALLSHHNPDGRSPAFMKICQLLESFWRAKNGT